MRTAVWPVPWMHPEALALLGGLPGVNLASPRGVVEVSEPMHLKLELVESQGQWLYFGVEEGLGRGVGFGIEF